MSALFILLLLAASVLAQTADGDLAGRAGVHDISQKFGSATASNPAQFACSTDYRWSLELLSFGVSAWNNTFSTKFWNRNIAGDHVYDAGQKQEILDRIPSVGMRVLGQASVPLIGFTYNEFGGRIALHSMGTATMPKDLAVLAAEGNRLSKEYSISTLRGEGMVLMEYSLGLGHTFEQEYLRRISAGANIHFYQGLALAKIAEIAGSVVLYDSLIDGAAAVHSIESTSGDGAGFDLGAIAELDDRWQVGLAVRQIGVRMSWNVDENRIASFVADSARISMDSLEQEDYFDRLFSTEDSTYSGGDYETRLPVIVQANARFAQSRRTTLLGEFAFTSKGSALETSLVSVGAAVQYLPKPWFQLQGGLAGGSPVHLRCGGGFGLRFSRYEFDLGGEWEDGLFNSARGFSFGIVHRLKF